MSEEPLCSLDSCRARGATSPAQMVKAAATPHPPTISSELFTPVLRAEYAHGTPTQSHISPSTLVYEDKSRPTQVYEEQISRHQGSRCYLSRPRSEGRSDDPPSQPLGGLLIKRNKSRPIREDISLERQGQKLAMTVLHVSHSLDSGRARGATSPAQELPGS